MTGGGNRIEMEDLAGAQRVDTSSPTLNSYLHLGTGAYQFEGNTDGQGWFHTGGDMETTVDAAKTEDVLANVLETYRSSQTTTVVGPVIETLTTSRTSTTTGPVDNTYAGPLTETVTNPTTEHYKAGLKTAVTAATTLTYDVGETLVVQGDCNEVYGATQVTDVTGTLTHTVTGPALEVFGATSTRTIAGDYTLTSDGTMTLVANKFEGAVASWNNFDDSVKEFLESSVSDMIGTDLALTGISMSAVGARLNIWLKMLSLTGLSISLNGPNIRLSYKHNDLTGLNLRFAPVALEFGVIAKVKKTIMLVI
jgi:hypothetical protein